MSPDEILDRTDACRLLGISRQTLIAWIRKGKLKVWKRVGHGTNAALLFARSDVESLCSNPSTGLVASTVAVDSTSARVSNV